MFTGIVTDVGEITSVTPGGTGGDRRFVIAHQARHGADRHRRLDRLLGLLPDGGREGRRLVRRRSLGRDAWTRPISATGSRAAAINLELSLKLGDELGGHLVYGHVDGVGKIVSMTPEGGSVRFVFEAPAELARFIASKGSIAIDGISLTVNEVEGNRFGVNIISHTQAVTTLGQAKPGQRVNLEVDMLARYVQRLLEHGKS